MFMAVGTGSSGRYKHLMGLQHLLFHMTLEAVLFRHLHKKRLVRRPLPGEVDPKKPEPPHF